MTVYAISFHLEYDNTESYNRRYDSLMERLRGLGTTWTETSSFVLVETSKSLDDINIDVLLSDFRSRTDTIIAIDVTYRSAMSWGKIDDSTRLRSLLPGISLN